MALVQYDETAGRFVARLEEEDYHRLDEIIARYRDKPGYLIPALKDAQALFGFLPMEVQQYLGKGLKISSSHIYGVVTFYAFFTTVPRGRHVARCCMGTACYVKGAQEIVNKVEDTLHIKVGEITKDLSFSLEVVRCAGACGLAPVMFIDDDVHGMLEPDKIDNILGKY
jgi:NADH:ubiquinone oxidoreductase subunit E